MTLRQIPFRTGTLAFSRVAHHHGDANYPRTLCIYVGGENAKKKWLYAACTHLRTSRLKPEDRYFICMPHFMRVRIQTRSEEPSMDTSNTRRGRSLSIQDRLRPRGKQTQGMKRCLCFRPQMFQDSVIM